MSMCDTAEYRCDPLPYRLTDEELAAIERHRSEQCPNGGPCKDLHMVMPLDRNNPCSPMHGCVVCGEPVA